MCAIRMSDAVLLSQTADRQWPSTFALVRQRIEQRLEALAHAKANKGICDAYPQHTAQSIRLRLSILSVSSLSLSPSLSLCLSLTHTKRTSFHEVKHIPLRLVEDGGVDEEVVVLRALERVVVVLVAG